MRSVTSKKEIQKKKSGAVLWGILALVVILGTVFTLARFAVIKIPGLTPAEAAKNTIQVAVLNAAAAQGISPDGITTLQTWDLDVLAEEGQALPDDVVTSTAGLSDKVLRISLAPNTILTESMLADKEENYKMDNTARYRDVDFITLNPTLQVGDVVDVRYIEYEIDSHDGTLKRNDVVVAKKEVVNLGNKVVTLELSADELTLLQSAAVEMDSINSKTKDTNCRAELILTTYKQPTLQKASIVTYTNADASRINAADPNLFGNTTVDTGSASNQDGQADTNTTKATTPAANG